MIKWWSESLLLMNFNYVMYSVQYEEQPNVHNHFFQKAAFHDLVWTPWGRPFQENTRSFVLFSPQLILVITATSSGGVIFQAGALYCIENKKF